LTENGNRMTRAELIQWLGNAISTETSKPFEEINHEFVDECSRLLDELLGTSVQMPEDLLAKLTAKLDEADPPPVQKKIGFFKRNLRKIVVAAAVILCMSVTVIAVPALRNILCDVLQMDVGDSIKDGGISYINAGKGTTYSDMNTLIAEEKLDILSFEDPQKMLEIKSIKYINENTETYFIFKDSSISFIIYHDKNIISESIQNNAQHITLPYANAYILQKDISNAIAYYAYFIYHDDTYIISCTSQDTLSAILNALTSTTLTN